MLPIATDCYKHIKGCLTEYLIAYFLVFLCLTFRSIQLTYGTICKVSVLTVLNYLRRHICIVISIF